MLIKKIQTVQEFVNSAASLTLDQLKSPIQDAEEAFIVPVLGRELYDDLCTAYEPVSSALSGPGKLLLPYLQKAISFFAMALWVPEGMVKVDGDGIHIVSNDTMKTAFQWQTDKLELNYLNKGYNAIESLYAYLERNKDDFPTWTSSTAYSESRELFVPNAYLFNAHFYINGSRRLFMRLRPTIKKVEDFYIKATLGEEYFNELKATIAVADPVEEDQIVILYIRNALTQLAIAKAVKEGLLDVNADGVFINIFNSGTQVKQPVEGEYRYQYAHTCHQDGENYLTQLRKYLNKNASLAEYTTYFNSDTWTDPSDPLIFPNSTTNGYYSTR
jgi:hypothetical protein